MSFIGFYRQYLNEIKKSNSKNVEYNKRKDLLLKRRAFAIIRIIQIKYRNMDRSKIKVAQIVVFLRERLVDLTLHVSCAIDQ